MSQVQDSIAGDYAGATWDLYERAVKPDIRNFDHGSYLTCRFSISLCLTRPVATQFQEAQAFPLLQAIQVMSLVVETAS